MDPYTVLGVSPSDDFETVKVAYRRLVRDNHPDVARDKVAATARMAQINDAWRLIGDVERRTAYDARVRFEAIERENKRREQLESEKKKRLHSERSHNERSHSERIQGEPRRRHRNEREKQSGARPTKSTSRSAPPSATSSKLNSKTNSATSRSSSKTHSAKVTPREKRLKDKLKLARQLVGAEGRADEAMALCRSVLLSDGRNVEAREIIGDVYTRQGRIGHALMMFDQAVQLSPGNGMLRQKRDMLQKSQNSRKVPTKVKAPTKVAAKVEKAPKPPSFWGRLKARMGFSRK